MFIKNTLQKKDNHILAIGRHSRGTVKRGTNEGFTHDQMCNCRKAQRNVECFTPTVQWLK